MTGNAGIDKIILLVCLLMTLVTSGLTLYAHMGIKRPPIDEQAEFDSLVAGAKRRSQSEAVPIKKLTINLYSRSTRLRYLDIQLNILPFDSKQAEKIQQFESIIADSVITIAGDMEAEEINSVSGKIILENRIKTHVNSISKDPIIKKIYFSRFVIQ